MFSTGLPMDPKSTTPGFDSKHWKVNPHTGIINLSEEAFKGLCNSDPFEKWYTIDQEPIARGQFAAVYRCMHRITGDEFAAKFSSKRRLGSDCTADLVHEVAVCALLKGVTKVVGLVDVFDTTSEQILVMEYAPGGDLQTLLDEDLVPYERNVICFLRQLLEGLVFIHDKNIVHLDIKPQNLVLMGDFPDCCVKLCDFEISRVLTLGYEVREILGTADYVAPEIIHYEPITTKTDMWSFGVLTYVLLTGFLPFGGETDQETFLEITRGELDFPEELFEDISEHAIDFIKRLLIRQPHLRMSAKECIEHAWMKADTKIPKLPQTVYLNPLNTIASSHTSPDINLNTKQQNHFLNQQNPAVNSSRASPILSLTPAIHTPPNLNEMEFSLSLQKAFEILESGTHMSPSAATPINITPNILSPMNSPRDNGLPPLHPYMSTRVCPSAHSSTSSLNKGNSRQSLERLRSISKSREILVERLQNSSQRKVLSRSRERLCDGRYCLPNIDNGLFEHRSFSHSVETLPPNDWYPFDESLCNSYNSINMLPLSVLPMVHENNLNNRHYKSMASVDRYNEPFYNKNLKNMGNYFSSKNQTEETDYDRIISRYKSTVNDVCSRTNRNSKHFDEVDTALNNNYIRKNSYENKANNNKKLEENKMIQTRKPKESNESNPKSKKNDKSKKDPQKRKKEKEKSKKLSTCSQESNGKTPQNQHGTSKTSVNKGRGSVSHIEQRIQVRHERQIEKQENLKKNKRKDQTQNKTFGNSKPQTEQTKTSKDQKEKIKLSNTHSNTLPAEDNVSETNTSPSVSLESVRENKNNNNKDDKKGIEKSTNKREEEKKLRRRDRCNKEDRKIESKNKCNNKENKREVENICNKNRDKKEETNINNKELEKKKDNKNKNNKKEDKKRESKSKHNKKEEKRKEAKNKNKKEDKKSANNNTMNSPETKIIIVVDKPVKVKVDKENVNIMEKSVNLNLKLGRRYSKEFQDISKTKDKLASYDDTVDDGIFSRSNSMDSSTSIDSASTIKAEENPTEIIECILKNTKVSNAKDNRRESRLNEINKMKKNSEQKVSDLKSSSNKRVQKEQTCSHLTSLKGKAHESRLDDALSKETKEEVDTLTIIKEEEENTQSNIKKTTPEKVRKNNIIANKIQLNNTVTPKSSPGVHKFSTDMTNRSKSFSMQSRTSLFPIKLSRSNSIHLDTPLSGKPRPWGEVCNGAVHRACQMFSEKSVDIALVLRKSSDPTSDRL